MLESFKRGGFHFSLLFPVKKFERDEKRKLCLEFFFFTSMCPSLGGDF